MITRIDQPSFFLGVIVCVLLALLGMYALDDSDEARPSNWTNVDGYR